MSAFFVLKKEPSKKILIFLMDCYFVMSGPIGMNVDLFLEISVGFPIIEA